MVDHMATWHVLGECMVCTDSGQVLTLGDLLEAAFTSDFYLDIQWYLNNIQVLDTYQNTPWKAWGTYKETDPGCWLKLRFCDWSHIRF